MKTKTAMPSFTLLEMIISMIIGAVIIGAIFMIFDNLRITWGQVKAKQDNIVTLLQFNEVVNGDIESATYITHVSPKTFYFLSEHDTIKYTFDTKIVRNRQTQFDTFPLATSNLNVKYELDNLNTKLVSSISFSINKPYDIGEVKFYKHYSSQQLLFALLNQKDGH